MGVTLLEVTCTPVVDSGMVQITRDDLSEWQETPGHYQEDDDHHGNVMNNQIPVNYGKGSVAKEGSEYQGLNAMVTVRKTKKQCQQEIMTKGYTKMTQECKNKFKYERDFCQIQADLKGVVVGDLCKNLWTKICTKRKGAVVLQKPAAGYLGVFTQNSVF